MGFNSNMLLCNCEQLSYGLSCAYGEDVMSNRLIAALAGLALLSTTGPALAVPTIPLPASGVLELAVLGVAGAIALRWIGK